MPDVGDLVEVILASVIIYFCLVPLWVFVLKSSHSKSFRGTF